MKFTKMHGIGNDFVVMDARTLKHDWQELAMGLCDRHFGIGADGLILVLPSRKADLRMRMYNPDGSESEQCGNGLRCFVKYALDRNIVSARNGALSIETLAGVLPAQVTAGNGRVTSVRVSMGRPRFEPREIPVAIEAEPPLTDVTLDVDGQGLSVTCLSMGNPHAVLLSADPVESFPLEAVGPKVEHHSLFPNRVNFEVAHIRARDQIDVRVWERGAGPTLACGSGAAAVMVAARLHERVDDRATVHLPGGDLTLEWDGAGDVFLTGPAVELFNGEWAPDVKQ